MSESQGPTSSDGDATARPDQDAWSPPASWPPPVAPPAVPPQPGWQQQPTWQQGAPYAGAGQQGWTPPPKPGLFPLRPMPFGTLFGTPFRVLRHNPRATVGGSLIVQLISTFATVLVVGLTTVFAVTRVVSADVESPGDQQVIIAGTVAIVILAALVSVLISLIGTALVQGLVASEVARGALGEKLTLRALWRATRGSRWRLIGWTALVAAAAIVSLLIAGLLAAAAASTGSVLLIVLVVLLAVAGLVALWIWLGTKTALTPSAIVVEHANVFVAVRRSWVLTRRSFWRTFGTLALIAVVCSFASYVVAVPLQLIYSVVLAVISPTGSIQEGGALTVTIVYYAVSLTLSTLIGTVTAVIEAAAATTVYLDLRMRREGLDSELRRVTDARAAGLPDASDPFATPAPFASRAPFPPASAPAAPTTYRNPW
ncbi:hypothetical protein [Humibacter albus]|uniref:hypothetical protein n=1 Tax=Humibacter albus TaxID=427754 RepID=UPI0003B63DF7|nr:hypothetical protein [Humibacter albus]